MTAVAINGSRTRTECPSLPVTPAQQAVAGWSVLPDFASVNFYEDGAEQLADLLLARGVGVEAGLCDAVKRFAASGLTRRCLRVLLEPDEQDTSAALQTVARIEAVLDRVGIPLPRLLYGSGDRVATH